VLVLLLDECSLLEAPLGELSFEVEDDDECSLVVVAGATGAGATTIGAGATTTGAAYTTAGGGGALVVVVMFELLVSVESAKAKGTIPNSTTTPKATVALFNEYFKMSPLIPQIGDIYQD
jgi:hypothetical protein